jgi:hypothetical protein
MHWRWQTNVLLIGQDGSIQEMRIITCAFYAREISKEKPGPLNQQSVQTWSELTSLIASSLRNTY